MEKGLWKTIYKKSKNTVESTDIVCYNNKKIFTEDTIVEKSVEIVENANSTHGFYT